MEWAIREFPGWAILRVDVFQPDFDLYKVTIGNLPLNLVAKICEAGNRFFGLEFKNLPQGFRGKEISLEQMDEFGAYLEEYVVVRPQKVE